MNPPPAVTTRPVKRITESAISSVPVGATPHHAVVDDDPFARIGIVEVGEAATADARHRDVVGVRRGVGGWRIGWSVWCGRSAGWCRSRVVVPRCWVPTRRWSMPDGSGSGRSIRRRSVSPQGLPRRAWRRSRTRCPSAARWPPAQSASRWNGIDARSQPAGSTWRSSPRQRDLRDRSPGVRPPARSDTPTGGRSTARLPHDSLWR